MQGKDEIPMFKPWRFDCSSPEFASELNKLRCDKSHLPHAQCEGQFTQGSGTYSPKLANAFCNALLKLIKIKSSMSLPATEKHEQEANHKNKGHVHDPAALQSSAHAVKTQAGEAVFNFPKPPVVNDSSAENVFPLSPQHRDKSMLPFWCAFIAKPMPGWRTDPRGLAVSRRSTTNLSKLVFGSLSQ